MKTYLKNSLGTVFLIIYTFTVFAQSEKTNIIQGTDSLLKSNYLQEFTISRFNTHFIIPKITLNSVEESSLDTHNNVLYFNSIGPRIPFVEKNVLVTADSSYYIVSSKFGNALLFQDGVLYHITPTELNPNNAFTSTRGLNILNFSLSVGKEFSNSNPSQRKKFVKISYNVPISGLISNNFYILKSSKSK